MGYLEGFAVGATDEYLKQRGDDRQEERDIKKENRLNKFQTLRDKRLAEINAAARAEKRDFDKSERIAGQVFTAGENKLTRQQQTSEREGGQKHDLNKMGVGQGYDLEKLNLSLDHKTSERQGGEAHDTGMLTLGQQFTADQANIDRNFTAKQNELNRDLTTSERQALQAHQLGIQQLSQDFKTSERLSSQDYSTGERMSSEANDLAKMILEKDIDQQNMKLSYGQAVVDVSDPANPVVKYTRGDKPLAPSASGAHTAKTASKFFSAEAKAYYGKLDESGVTNFGTSRNADLANRASAISMQLYNKFGGRVDPNTVFSMVFQHLATQRAQLDPEGALRRLTEYVDNAENWLTGNMDEEETKTATDMQTQIDKDKETIRTDLTLPGAEATLPPAAVSKLKEGTVTTFSNGQKWTLRNGKPVQVQ